MSSGSIGTLGYDDDQPQTAWDDAELWWSAGSQVTGAIASGVQDCSRWGYTILVASVAGHQGNLTLTWADKAAGGVVLGVRTIMLDPNIANPLFCAIPNAGPWVSGTFSEQTPANQWTPTIRALFTNRARPNPASPQGAAILDNAQGNLAASGAVNVYPADYFAGTAGAYLGSGNTAIDMIFLYLKSNWTYRVFTEVDGTATKNTTTNVILPLGAWRMNVLNTSTTVANTGSDQVVTPLISGI